MIQNPFEAIDLRLQQIQKKLDDLQESTSKPVAKSHESETFLDTKDVALLLGVSEVTIWQWEKKGILQSYRIGNLKRFKHSEVIACPKPIKRTRS